MDIVITTNSPGEVAGWVKPTVKSLKKTYPRGKISVFLPPCIFASGSEKEVLINYPEVDYVYNKSQYLKYILLGKKPSQFDPGAKGIVIFLGGDLFHAYLLGKKLNFPVIAYSEGVYNWGGSIAKFMVPNQGVKDSLLKKGALDSKVEVIGNLMLNSIETSMTPAETRKKLDLQQEKVITIFPGSRPHEIEYMLPFFLDSLSAFSKKDDYTFSLGLSPFVSKEELSKIFQKYLLENGIKGEFINKKDYGLIKLFKKFEVRVYPQLQYELMQITDLALTIPGTNNLQLAYFTTPMLVILPLNQPELIPLEGLIGLVGQIPGLGPLLKKIVVPKIVQKRDFTALPNIITKKEIVPELKGVLTPSAVVNKMEKLLSQKQKLQKMRHDLKNNFQSVSASDRITEIVGQVLASNP
mgnify:CR=1 FL=1